MLTLPHDLVITLLAIFVVEQDIESIKIHNSKKQYLFRIIVSMERNLFLIEHYFSTGCSFAYFAQALKTFCSLAVSVSAKYKISFTK